MRSFTVAVLECDTPIPPVLDKFGTYGDIFKQFLTTSLDRYMQNGGTSRVNLKVVKSNMVEMGDLFEFEEVDCLLLSGGSA